MTERWRTTGSRESEAAMNRKRESEGGGGKKITSWQQGGPYFHKLRWMDSRGWVCVCVSIFSSSFSSISLRAITFLSFLPFVSHVSPCSSLSSYFLFTTSLSYMLLSITVFILIVIYTLSWCLIFRLISDHISNGLCLSYKNTIKY